MQTTYGVGEYRTGEAGLFVRRATSPLHPRRLSVGVHPAGGSALTGLTDAATRLLADCGYPVHVGDYGSSTYNISGGVWTYGNSDSVTAIGAAVTWAATQGAKTDKLFVFGGSMGAVGALNFAKANPGQIGALALSVPLLDINDLTSNDKGGGVVGGAASTLSVAALSGAATLTLVSGTGFSTTGLPGVTGFANKANVMTISGMQAVNFTAVSGNQLTGVTGLTANANQGAAVTQGYGASCVTAYGVTWPNLLSSAQLAANSPVVWGVQTEAVPFPIKIWSSDNDPVASNTAACQAWAAAVASAGSTNVLPIVESLGAVGHLAGAPAAEVLAFFDANGGRS